MEDIVYIISSHYNRFLKPFFHKFRREENKEGVLMVLLEILYIVLSLGYLHVIKIFMFYKTKWEAYASKNFGN